MAMSIGGFFATLSLKSDQASFDNSKKQLGEIEEKVKKTGLSFGTFVGDAIKGLTALGAAAVGAAYSVSQIQGKMAVSATGAGMKFEEYNKLAVAMSLVHGNMDELGAKLMSFEDTLSGLAIGRKGEEFAQLAKDLAIFGQVDINKFKALSQVGRLELISNMVTSEKDPTKRKAMEFAAGNMFGASFLTTLQTFRSPNSEYKNFSQLWAQAGKSATDQNGADALANMQAFNRLLTDLGQDFTLVGEKLGTAFRKPMKELMDYMEAHKADFSNFADGLGKGMSTMFDGLSSVFKALNSIFIDNPVMKFFWENVGKGADFGAHFDRAKGFDTDEKRALAAKVRSTMGWGEFDDRSLSLNSWSPAYVAEQQYHDKTGKYLSQSQLQSATAAGEKYGINLVVNVDKSGNVTYSSSLDTVKTK